MKPQRSRGLGVRVVVVGVLGSVLVGAPATPACDGQPANAQPAPVNASAEPATDGASAMRIYRDPVTGEFTTPPERAPAEAAPEAARSRPVPVIEPNPAGGVKIHLGKEYAHTMRATRDATGKPAIDCVPAGAGKE